VTAGIEDELSGIVNVGELVPIVREDIWLLDRQPVTNPGANWLRKTAKIRTAALAFRESIVFEKVCGVGDETPIVLSEIFASHVTVVLGAVQQTFQVQGRITTTTTEVWVAQGNLGLENGESRRWLISCCHTGSLLPDIAFGSSVSHSPTDGFRI
jgi:hypothetical protein